MQIVSYTAADEAGARALNDRLRARGKTEFLLPEKAIDPGPETAPIRDFHYLAREGEMVRGGFLLASYPAAFADGEEAAVLNAREPLSEGLIDPKYSLLALRLLKHMQQQGRYLFALGMGSEEANFTRLLKGAGWTIRPVPFFFRVLRASSFFNEISVLRSTRARRVLGRAAALSGAGKLGITALQGRSLSPLAGTRGLSVEKISAWGDWADKLWHAYRPLCSFAVRRDRATLAALYPLGKDRSEAFLLNRNGNPVGWMAALNSKMSSHKFFGNMQVATILDGVTEPELMRPALALVTRELGGAGADLVVANHSHHLWREAFRGAGFLGTRSNYILAINKALSEDIARQPGGLEHVHFTRGDSDGRAHL